MLGKFRWDFTLGKVKKGKNSPAFCSARKVRAGFHPGKQATNSRKVTFTAGRVRAGLYPIYGGAIWAFIRVILLYAGAGLSHEACDGFAVIQGEIPTHFLPRFVARDSDTRSDAISDAEYEMLLRYRIGSSDYCGEIFECHDARSESDDTLVSTLTIL